MKPSPPPSLTSKAEVTHEPPPAVNLERQPSFRKGPVSPPVVREQGGNPPSAAFDVEKAQRVGELLAKADAAYDRGDILTLKGTSAGRYYKDVFAIDGTQIDAYQGMMRVIRKYVKWAGEGLYKGKVNGKHYLSMAKECLAAIPEGLKREHASEIETVNREIKALSSRLNTHETRNKERRRGSRI